MLILSLVLKQRSMVLYTYLFLNRPSLLTGNLLRVQYTVYVPERDHRMFPVSCVYNHYPNSTATVHISIKCILLFQHMICMRQLVNLSRIISEISSLFQINFQWVVIFPKIKKMSTELEVKQNRWKWGLKQHLQYMYMFCAEIRIRGKKVYFLSHI